MALCIAGSLAAAHPRGQRPSPTRQERFIECLLQGGIKAAMYEGPIRAADYAASEESPILRQLRWTDLVARIAATRDLRAAPAEACEEPCASFTAFQREAGKDGQHTVNRDALTHGKLSRIFPPDAANNAGDGDRETR